MDETVLIAICVGAVVLFALIAGILSRYRKCPSDKVLVIYGKVGSDKSGQARSAKCIQRQARTLPQSAFTAAQPSSSLLSSPISIWI